MALVMTIPLACTRAVALPTWCRTGEDCVGGGRLGFQTGVLHERAGCIWLTDNGFEYPVLWPPYYTVDFGPLTIMNRVGWHVAAEGTNLSYTVVASDLVDPCGRSPWVAVSPPDS